MTTPYLGTDYERGPLGNLLSLSSINEHRVFFVKIFKVEQLYEKLLRAQYWLLSFRAPGAKTRDMDDLPGQAHHRFVCIPTIGSVAHFTTTDSATFEPHQIIWGLIQTGRSRASDHCLSCHCQDSSRLLTNGAPPDYNDFTH